MTTLNTIHTEYHNRAKLASLNVQVISSGNVNSNIAIVSDYIGDRELALKMPMVGGAGKFLWEVMRKYKIDRRQVYVTNVAKRRVAVFDPTAVGRPIPKLPRGEFEHWAALLRWELSQLPNLEYILVLGGYALEALTGETGITKHRGSVYDRTVGDRPVRVVVANNPANVIREPETEIIFRFDIGKFFRVVDEKYKQLEIEHVINPTCAEALDWIENMRRAREPISFDIETAGGETVCIGLANSSRVGMCINFRGLVDHHYTLDEEARIRREMQALFCDPDIRLVAQNGVFDCSWLWYKDRIYVPRIWFDTLLAHHALFPTLPHNLGFLTSQYVDHPFYKDDKDEWKEGGHIDSFWEYNVKDVCITKRVQERLSIELEREGMSDFFHNHVMRIQPSCVRMGVCGIRGDIGLRERLADDLQTQVDALGSDLLAAARKATSDPDYNLNPRSNVQLRKLFFLKLGLVGRGTSVDETNRKRMQSHPRTSANAMAVLQLLDKFNEQDKFRSTYANMRFDEDGRIRTEYKQFGVKYAPGRLSSSQTSWKRDGKYTGCNYQNQMDRSHPMFVADDGYEFSYFDLKQAEAVVVAHLSSCKALLENFEKAATSPDFDVHRANASRIFRCSYADIPTKDRDEAGKATLRFLGKRCVHGLNYRMQSAKLAEVCDVSFSQADEARRSYFRAFPEILDWWERTIKEVRETKKLYNAYGRRLYILERIDSDDALDSVIAFRPQSTIGDKVQEVQYQLDNNTEFRRFGRVAINGHDSLIVLNKIEHGERVREIMLQYASLPILINGTPVYIGSDFMVSKAVCHTYEGSSYEDVPTHRWSTLQGVRV